MMALRGEAGVAAQPLGAARRHRRAL